MRCCTGRLRAGEVGHHWHVFRLVTFSDEHFDVRILQTVDLVRGLLVDAIEEFCRCGCVVEDALYFEEGDTEAGEANDPEHCGDARRGTVPMGSRSNRSSRS